MNRPPKTKRGPALVGGPLQLSPRKTRSATEAWGKKGQFYKQLPKQFRRDGFDYRQIAREGDAAIYEKTWLGCAEPSLCYEVIRIRCRDGFQIGGRFVEPAEVYPRSEFWGMNGFTFTNRDKAWAKFSEISLEKPPMTRKEVT
jgi:hypothetical protein